MTAQSWDEVAAEERRRIRARRARVLAHPDIAERLTQKPLQYPSPDYWTGYIPPAQIDRGSGFVDNNSPARRALIDICNAVLERERAIAEGRYQPDAEPLEPDKPFLTPSSPGSVTRPQLTRLHILFGEAGITERDDKLGYCQSVVDRPVDSTKNLSQNEASLVMDAISRIIHPEE